MKHSTIQFKIRGLRAVMQRLLDGETTPLEWCDEERDWRKGEKEEILWSLKQEIGQLVDRADLLYMTER